VPTFDALPFPVVLDVATSQVANGKIRERKAEAEPIPEEWTITESGEPVTDPEAYFEGVGALLPLGGTSSGYKGFGFGAVAELLAGTIGDWFVAGQRRIDKPDSSAALVGIDPLRFSSREDVEERITAFADRVRSAEKSPEIPLGAGATPEAGRLPGEPEHDASIDRRERGIPIPDRVVADLVALAGDYGCEDALPGAFR
jgi:uncharacterized oxidoreductase